MTQTKSGFTLGWNMAGYLPEMEPYSVDTAEEAREAMREEIERVADMFADRADDSRKGTDGDCAQAADEALADLNSADVSLGWDCDLDGYRYWITPDAS